jgi:signal transduction histidine kinase
MHLRDSSFVKAEEYMQKSLDIKKNIGDKYLLASGYNALSNIHFYKNEFEDSKKALSKGLKVLEKIKGEKADDIRAGLLLNMAYSMYKLEDYKAYEFQEKSWDLYDKIKDRKNQRIIADIYAGRNYNKGLQEGIYQQEIKRQRAQRNTWILGISSFFIIVLLVFVLKQYKLRQKNLGLELSKQELMQQQKLEKIRNDSQIRILNATLDGKESERKQIAETLHDSVSALLSSANLHLQACKTQFNGATPVEVDKSQSIINEASQKIRDLSHTLVSSILLKFGLSYAIKDIAEKFSNSQLQIDYETKYIKRYDQGFEIKLYNITQEFVNNILKHSNASYASIILVEKNKKLQLTIKDNGDGFDKELIPEKDGLGLNQIDARIQMMQGKFTIESGKGKGTTISIELPVFEKVLTKFS